MLNWYSDKGIGRKTEGAKFDIKQRQEKFLLLPRLAHRNRSPQSLLSDKTDR